jgi:hypothetical protein
LRALARRHLQADLLLLASGGAAPPPDLGPDGGWHRVVRRPASVAELVEAVRGVLPLPPDAARPLD